MLEGSFLYLLFFIVLSAFFSGAEVALLSISLIKVKSYIKENKKGAQALYRLKSNPQRMIITILIGNNMANFSAAALATIIATDLFGSSGISIGVGLITLVILIFGEITPKSLSSTYADRIALAIARPIEILSYFFYPVIFLLVRLNKVIHKILNTKPHSSLTETDIISTIELGLEKHLIEPQEEIIIRRALTLHDISASDIMTPKDKIFSLNAQSKISDVIFDAEKTSHSYFPVFEGKSDHIIGMVNTGNILRLISQGKINQRLKDLSTNPIFIPHNTKIDSLLHIFQNNQASMVFVTNQVNQLIGLITMKDILEELVGEITEEKDIQPGIFIRTGKNTVITHGETRIEKINRLFDTNLPEKYSSISQLINSEVPSAQKNTPFIFGGVQITVMQVHQDKIIKVRLEKI